MKVILLRDAPRVGRACQVADVAEGHARNFLIPRGYAKPASDENLREVAQARAAAERRQEKQIGSLEKLARQLNGLTLRFEEKPSPSGKLYAGVGAQRIAEELASRGLAVRKQEVVLPQPIKEPGEYRVVIALGRGIKAELRCQVSLKP